MINDLAQALELAGKNRGSVDDLLKYGFGENALLNALIAERDGEAVGMCTYFPIFSTWTGRPGVFVIDLFVSEVERGNGLGEQLLARLASISRERGTTFMRLSVDNHNVRSESFYRRIGFTPMEDECSYQIEIEKFS